MDKQGRLRAVFESLDNILSEEEASAAASQANSTWEKGGKQRLLDAVSMLLREPSP